MKRDKKNAKLSMTLIRMAGVDQKYRRTASFKHIDKIHTKSLRRIIKQYGWPTFTMVGKNAAHAAWLLAQHADHAPRFQAYCLFLLEKAVKAQEADSSDLAYLTDRVLVNAGKSQVYGTQFYIDATGRLVSRPIRNKQFLNRRRKQVGLGSFVSYQYRMKQNQNKLFKIAKRKIKY